MIGKTFLTVSLLAAASLSGAYAQTPVPAAQPATIDNNLKPKFIDQQPSDRLASKLIGSTIVDKNNASLGTIADIVFDDKNTVRSFVVSVGGVLGIGAKYVAVDPSVVMIDFRDNKFTFSIDTDKDQLRAAPEYRYADKK
jgi:sporulation protein YlmC with PRC-barrel domain